MTNIKCKVYEGCNKTNVELNPIIDALMTIHILLDYPVVNH